jgi:hypothetical protein
MHLLLRNHAGKAWFREPSLQVLATPAGAARFDGVPVTAVGETPAGFQVRDVAADSDYVRIEPTALQLTLACEKTQQNDVEFFDVTLTDASGKDRAVSLVYSLPRSAKGARWLVDPRHSEAVAPGREYISTTQFSGVGSNGYYQLFPQDFQCRTPEQGLWMPFAKISEVKGWEDFGFKFKEGDNETAWDDQHGMITFRYTEPLTWWMAMPDSVPRTIEAATAYAKTLAAEKGDRHAESLMTSGYHDRGGRLVARLLDTHGSA